MSTNATIADVAQAAQVSATTVSNFLNGRADRMRPATMERIQRAIAELGYQPNQAARQLKIGYAPILGLVVPSVANPFYGIFARYVEQAALARGHQVLLGNSERIADRETTYARELWSYGVRGIILASSLLDYTHLQSLIARGLHVIAFDRPAQRTDEVPFDSIGIDNYQAARLAVKHLLALGHTRIAFLSGPIRTVSRLDRVAGYRSALEEAGVSVDATLIWEGTATQHYGDVETLELGKQGAHELLSRPHPPTAIFTVNDMYAFGVYAGARDLGVRIPADISVVGFDDITLTEIVEPPLTTIRQPLAQIAKAAVNRLIDSIEGRAEGRPEHITFPSKLVVRASTGRCSRG